MGVENSNLIKQFYIKSALASFNAVNTVPLITTQQAIEIQKSQLAIIFIDLGYLIGVR